MLPGLAQRILSAHQILYQNALTIRIYFSKRMKTGRILTQRKNVKSGPKIRVGRLLCISKTRIFVMVLKKGVAKRVPEIQKTHSYAKEKVIILECIFFIPPLFTYIILQCHTTIKYKVFFFSSKN